MLQIPASTPYDLNFRLLDIPVRINPFFWLVSAYLGWQGRDGLEVLIWVACVFGSILVHEFGHGLTARAFTGQRPTVVLYGMGGLCSYDREERSAWQRVAVLLMGPGAGFLLFLAVVAFGALFLGVLPFRQAPLRSPPSWYNASVAQAYEDLIYINLYWGLFNLLPIYPLDGGQVAHVLFKKAAGRQGPRRCFILSLLTAGGLAIYMYTQGDTYKAILLGYLGFINYQLLQAAHYQARYGDGPDDDDDWWRR